MSNVSTTPPSPVPHNLQRAGWRSCTDRQAQMELERMLAKRRAAEAARAARFANLPTSARRVLHGNVVEWRGKAVEQRIRTLPLPPGEDGSKPVISERNEHRFLFWMSIIAIAVFAARAGGVL